MPSVRHKTRFNITSKREALASELTIVKIFMQRVDSKGALQICTPKKNLEI